MTENIPSEKTKKDHQDKPIINSVIIALAIILVGFLLIWNSNSTIERKIDSNAGSNLNVSDKMNSVKPINSSDHVRGDTDAPVKIIEFSDTECPFCKNFHITLKKVISDYNGQVAWVYRHFPIDSLHPKARKEAMATECAAELGGNEAFWIYLDRLFEITPSNNQLELDKLNEIANSIRLRESDFKLCVDSGKYADKISQSITDGMNVGVSGTPHSIVIAPNGKKFEIRGAQPYEAVKVIIEKALKEK